MRRRELFVNTPIGVLLHPDEVRFIQHLLISLKADDLVLEEARCDALAWITRVQQDISGLRQDPHRSSVSARDTTEQ